MGPGANSWDKVYRNAGWIHFLKVMRQVYSFPFISWIPETLGKKAPPQMTTKIQYTKKTKSSTLSVGISQRRLSRNIEIILAAELEETKNHLSAQTKINYVSPQPSSTLSKPSTMKLLMELASVSKKLNQHQPWFPEGNEVEPASWLSTVIYWPEPRSTGCSILKCTPTGNPTRKPFGGGDP